MRNQDIRLERNELARQGRVAIGIGARQAVIDADVAALRPSKLLEPLVERGHPRLYLWIGIRTVYQHPDTPHQRRLLRARHQRQGRRAAKQSEERATLHSITSSARASNVAGISRPSALAVRMF